MTQELEGAELDKAVAKVIGKECLIFDDYVVEVQDDGSQIWSCPFKPSTNWAQGGPLIEEYGIALQRHEHRWGNPCEPYWLAHWTNLHDSMHYNHSAAGSTPLIAAMRALVASKR